MTKLKLEMGKYYRTRDGLKVGPMNGISFKWVDDLLTDDCRWEWSNNGDGHFGAPDLIAEWTDTPTIGTLAEIGAQVGDVVKAGGYGRALTVEAIDRQRDRPYFLRNVDGDRDWYAGTFDMWRIISRASDDIVLTDEEMAIIEAAMEDERPKVSLDDANDRIAEVLSRGPVITETVKRIVPGVYGKVRVETDGPHIKTYIEISDYMSRDDLTEAIATLTAIRDAL